MSLKITLYHMNGCGACVAIKPIWNEIKDAFKNVNFDEIEQAKIIRNDISAFPTIIIEKNGKEVETIVGLRKFDELKKIILSHMEGQTGGRRKARKNNKKTSRKASKKTSKKKSRKTSRKLSRKTSKKASRKYKK